MLHLREEAETNQKLVYANSQNSKSSKFLEIRKQVLFQSNDTWGTITLRYLHCMYLLMFLCYFATSSLQSEGEKLWDPWVGEVDKHVHLVLMNTMEGVQQVASDSGTAARRLTAKREYDSSRLSLGPGAGKRKRGSKEKPRWKEQATPSLLQCCRLPSSSSTNCS